MELFGLEFISLLFYIELPFGFWITWISFPQLADSALDNIYIYMRKYMEKIQDKALTASA